jgi:peptidoglycan/LPS O-acetylase OafA/YrhL
MVALEAVLYIIFGLFLILIWIGFFVVGFLSFKKYPIRSAAFLLLCAVCLIGAISMSISGQSTNLPGPGPCAPLSSCPPGDNPLNGG